jgi:hypothetical protein
MYDSSSFNTSLISVLTLRSQGGGSAREGRDGGAGGGEETGGYFACEG